MPLEKLKILTRFDSMLTRFLVNALEKADHDALMHSITTAELCHVFARASQEDALKAETLWLAGFLHDIGKLGIATETLNKKSNLDGQERAAVQKHAALGKLIIERLFDDPVLARAVLYHHERFDGKGYPEGLAGEQIPYTARIVAVASTYDTMRSAGWVLKRRSHQDALAELQREGGKQFDPQVVADFVKIEPAVRMAHEETRNLDLKDIIKRI